MALNFKDTFGAVGDGSTPCGTKLALAAAQLGEGLYIPAGRYIIDQGVAQVLTSPNLPAGFSMFGDGDGATQLIFPNGDNIELIQTNARQGITVRDMSFITAKSGAGNKSALKLSSTGSYGQPAQSSISRVSFKGLAGADFGDDYWFCGIEVNGWECINFDTVHHVGSKQRGTGTRLTGTSPSKFGILYNFRGCLHEYNVDGILYDNWVQGVTVSGGSNFNQCSIGVHVPSSAQGELAQLAISDSQFDCIRYGVFTQQGVGGLQVHDCQMFVRDGQVGVYAPVSLFVQIHDNLIMGSGQAGQAQGVHVGGPALGGFIHGNIFRGMAYGTVLDSGVYGITIGVNRYSDCGKTLNWGGAANLVTAGE